MKSILLSIIILFSLSAFAQRDIEQLQLKSHSGIEITAEKGFIEVPESRNNPNSIKIKIEFVRLKSFAEKPAAPVFYLAGGPGNSATWQANHPMYLENYAVILQHCDIILFDQRGTGLSSNRLMWYNKEIPPGDVFVTEAAANQYFASMSKKALQFFDERGVDIQAYTTTENAKDLDALREALGYEKINLLGFSYGTQLGLAYISAYKPHIDNAILAGVEGLDQSYKLPLSLDRHFEKLCAVAQKDSSIKQDIPDLLKLYSKVSNQMMAHPITIEITNPITRQPMPLKIGKFGLDHILRRDFGDATDLPIFPRLLYSIEQGDYSLLQWFVQKRIRDIAGIQAMMFSMDIASGVDAERLTKIKQQEKLSIFGGITNAPFLHLRENKAWPVQDLGDDFRSFKDTPVRTLFLSGSWDSNTPPKQAAEVMKAFENGTHIIVDQAGHEQILSHPKMSRTIAAFLKGEDVSNRTLSYPTLQFIPVQEKEVKSRHPALEYLAKARQ